MTDAENTRLRQAVAWIDRRLVRAYGEPEPWPQGDPLDGLIATILSQNTSDTNSGRAYKALVSAFPTWEAVMRAPRRQLERVLRPGGLARTKSARIQRLLASIAETGALSLDSVRNMTNAEAEGYLLGFDGVGYKTVRCVLLFELGRDVFPIDTHVHRILTRMGVLPPGMSAERARVCAAVHREGAVFFAAREPDSAWTAGLPRAEPGVRAVSVAAAVRVLLHGRRDVGRRRHAVEKILSRLGASGEVDPEGRGKQQHDHAIDGDGGGAEMPREPEPQAGGREEEREDIGPLRAAGQPDDAHDAEDGDERALQEGLGAEETEYAEYGVGGEESGGDPDVPGNDGTGLAFVEEAPRAREMVGARLALAFGESSCHLLVR